MSFLTLNNFLMDAKVLAFWDNEIQRAECAMVKKSISVWHFWKIHTFAIFDAEQLSNRRQNAISQDGGDTARAVIPLTPLVYFCVIFTF
jgi:hypothetical protein